MVYWTYAQQLSSNRTMPPRYLRDIDFQASPGHAQTREFNASTHCVVSAYLHALGKVEGNGTWKIVVVAYGEPEKLCEAVGGVGVDLLGVRCVNMLFDYGGYWAADKQQRKRMLLDRLHESVLLVCETVGISSAPFARAYETVLANGIRHERLWGRLKLNRQRTRRASIWYEFDADKIEVFAVAGEASSSGWTIKRKLFDCPPDDWYLYDALGRSRWVDEHTFELTANTGPRHVTPVAGKTWRARF